MDMDMVIGDMIALHKMRMKSSQSLSLHRCLEAQISLKSQFSSVVRSTWIAGERDVVYDIW